MHIMKDLLVDGRSAETCSAAAPGNCSAT